MAKRNTDREDAAQELRELTAAASVTAEAPVSAGRSRAAAPKHQKVVTAAEQAYADRLAELRREQAANLRSQAQAARTGKAAPVAAVNRFRRADPTAVPEHLQKAYPGKRFKWVAGYDANGRETDRPYAVDRHENENFEVVKEDGKEVRGPFGVLMAIDPVDAAEREMAYRPAGAVAPEDYHAGALEQLAQQENRKAGERVLGIQRMESHGHHVSDSLYE